MKISYKSLAVQFGASILALTLGGCSVIPYNGNGSESGASNPCKDNNIEKIPQSQVTQQEIDKRIRAGEVGYFYNGYLLYGQRSLFERFGEAGGAVAGGAVAGRLAKGSSNVRLATTGGIVGGLILGEFFANSEKLARLARESHCEAYIDQIGPAPFRKFIGDGRADRPHGVAAKIFDQPYELMPAPYSDTSPGGRLDPSRRNIPKPLFGG